MGAKPVVHAEHLRHARIQKGGGGVQNPAEKSQNIEFPCNTGPDPLKIKKAIPAKIKCWAIIGPPAKPYLNDVSLAGR